MKDRPSPDHHQIWQEDPVEHLQQPERRTRPRKSRAGRARPRGRWLLAIVGYGALAFTCLGVAALAFLAVAAPLDVVRDRLIEQVKARTGRELAVAGPTSFSLFPRLAVSLTDVALSAPEDMPGAPTLAMPSLEVELRLWSLLTRQAAVERLTLRSPTIELVVDAQGRRSWDFGSASARPLQPTPADANSHDQQPPVEPAPAAASKTSAALARLGIGSVRVVDATLRYRDEGSGAHYEIKSLDLALTANDLAGPLEINGMLPWRGVQIGFSGTASPLRALLTEQPALVAFKASGAPLEAAYEGTLALAGGPSLDGKVSIKAPSARALSEWLGNPLPASTDADTLAVSAHLTAARGQVALSQLDALLGDTSVAGALAVETGQARPVVSGKLQISELDFGKMLVRPRKRATASDTPASRPSSTPAPSPPPNTRASRRDWSDDAVDPRILGLVDADLALSVGRLAYKEMRTGQSRLSVLLKGGTAKVTLEDVELYNGRGRGVLTLDGTGEALVAGTNLKLIGVSMLPLLTDALGFQWLDGRGNIALALAGQGLSERQFVESSNGTLDVAVANGAITGIDVGKILQSLQQGRLPSLTPASDDKTPFSELAGTFAITNGVANNQDLTLASTRLRLTGEGALDLGQRQIDYTMRAKVGGGPPAPGAVLKIGSLEIPIGIEGPWEKPVFKIKGQEQLTGALKQIGKNLKSQDVRDAIKGLFRGDGEQRVKPRELLEKLLKKE